MRSFCKALLMIMLTIVISFSLTGCGGHNNNNTLQKHNLILSITGEGTTSGCGNYSANADVTVTATSANGYDFDGWYNGETLVSNENPYTFKMPASDYAIKALFTQLPQQLVKYAVVFEESIKGTLIGDGEYEAGEEVEILATPNQNYEFSGWYIDETLLSTQNPYSFFMLEENLTITALFNEIIEEPDTSLYTLSLYYSGLGTVTGEGMYEVGELVIVTATPFAGYVFDGWYINGVKVSSYDYDYMYMPENNVTLTAIFILETKYTLTVTKTTGGYVMGDMSVLGSLNSSSSSFSKGETINLIAYATSGYKFDGWYINGVKIYSFNNYSFIISNNTTIQARFIKQ